MSVTVQVLSLSHDAECEHCVKAAFEAAEDLIARGDRVLIRTDTSEHPLIPGVAVTQAWQTTHHQVVVGIPMATIEVREEENLWSDLPQSGDLQRLAAEIEERPSVCGTSEDDQICMTAPSWRSTSECCGWTDEACTRHRETLDKLFERESISCGNCGHRVVLRWSAL